MYPVIDIPSPSPSLKRTRSTEKKLPIEDIISFSRTTGSVNYEIHGNTSLWRHLGKTMVVAGSVGFLMMRRKKKKRRRNEILDVEIFYISCGSGDLETCFMDK